MTRSEKIFEDYPGSNLEDDLEKAELEARPPIRRLFYQSCPNPDIGTEKEVIPKLKMTRRSSGDGLDVGKDDKMASRFLVCILASCLRLPN